ncbi:hypothetical protein D3C86_1592740 [compost metagenome]
MGRAEAQRCRTVRQTCISCHIIAIHIRRCGLLAYAVVAVTRSNTSMHAVIQIPIQADKDALAFDIDRSAISISVDTAARSESIGPERKRTLVHTLRSAPARRIAGGHDRARIHAVEGAAQPLENDSPRQLAAIYQCHGQ